MLNFYDLEKLLTLLIGVNCYQHLNLLMLEVMLFLGLRVSYLAGSVSMYGIDSDS